MLRLLTGAVVIAVSLPQVMAQTFSFDPSRFSGPIQSVRLGFVDLEWVVRQTAYRERIETELGCVRTALRLQNEAFTRLFEREEEEIDAIRTLIGTEVAREDFETRANEFHQAVIDTRSQQDLKEDQLDPWIDMHNARIRDVVRFVTGTLAEERGLLFIAGDSVWHDQSTDLTDIVLRRVDQLLADGTPTDDLPTAADFIALSNGEPPTVHDAARMPEACDRYLPGLASAK